MTRTLIGIALVAGLGGVAGAQQAVTVELNDAQNKPIGMATLTPASNGVGIALELKGLPPGDHALHVHTTPKCEGPAFASAGGHFNPGSKKHGMKNPDGPHAGDSNNFTVAADGTAKTTVAAPGVTLAGGANSVFTNGGTAVVIHARGDDMMTDPAGNSGDPIACGVIVKRVNEASVQQVLGISDRTAWIVTSSDGGAAGGLVATFVTNASLVPRMPRLAVGIARHHHTWELITRSRVFAAHLVDEAASELLWCFGHGSGRERNKFADMRWRRGVTGSPVLEDALAWLDCEVESALDIGDRTIFVAAVVDGQVNRDGAAVTENRLMELVGDERRRQFDEERRRDEKLDATAILEWRAASK